MKYVSKHETYDAKIAFRKILLASTIEWYHNVGDFVFLNLDFGKFGFSVVTKFPRAESSFGNVFTPFDASTWTLMLTFCVVITLVIQFIYNLPNNKAEYGVIFVRDLITFISILLNQNGGDIVKSLQKQRKAVPILAVWFFGGYVLMENLYQGSITSDLTVTPFPAVPKSFEGLAKSNLTIITSSTISSPSGEHKSFIKFLLLPLLHSIRTSGDNKFGSYLSNFIQRMVYIPPFKNDWVEFARIISNSGIIRSNNSEFRTSDTFAIVDQASDLVTFTALIKTLGKRLVIDNLQNAPFQFNTFTDSSHNYISTTIATVFARLMGSGIYGRWELLETMRIKLLFVHELGEGFSRKLFLKFTSNFRESNVQMYNSEGEAFPALFYVFGLCATVIAVAVVSLLVECKLVIMRVLAIARVFIRRLGDYVGYLARCSVY